MTTAPHSTINTDSTQSNPRIREAIEKLLELDSFLRQHSLACCALHHLPDGTSAFLPGTLTGLHIKTLDEIRQSVTDMSTHLADSLNFIL